VGTVTIIRDAVQGQDGGSGDGARMTLASESGKLILAVDIAPRSIDYGGFAHDWSQADRTGREPLLLHKGTPLETLSFSFLMTDRIDHQEPQTSKVHRLREIARTFERIVVRFSSTEQGLWRITEVGLSSELRAAATDEITRGTVSLTLTRASDPAPAVGPIRRNPPPPPTPPKVNRTYVVVRGDCLWSIARRFYGNGALFTRIYDANRRLIRKPSLIYPGQRLVIP
jgi:LysM domain